jgi:hypothetical protein
MGMQSLTGTVEQGLQDATQRFYQRWLAQRQPFRTENDRHGELERTQNVLQQLLWSCVQQGVKSDVVTQLLSTQDKQQRVFQLHILRGLLARDGLYDETMSALLTDLLTSPLHKVSELAAQLLAREGAGGMLDWQDFLTQPEQLHNDRFTSALQQAAAQRTSQAQVLPVLISRQDTVTLQAIAADEQQQESLRTGAIEGLARILNEAAGQALSDIHNNSADQDVARAAYRALRRQQRSRQKAAQSATAGAGV